MSTGESPATLPYTSLTVRVHNGRVADQPSGTQCAFDKVELREGASCRRVRGLSRSSAVPQSQALRKVVGVVSRYNGSDTLH
jgi:hypothetical protein